MLAEVRPRRCGCGRARRARRRSSSARSCGSMRSDQALGEHGDAVATAVREALDDRARQGVDERLEADLLAGELLGDQRRASRRRPCRCRARGGRPCGPSRSRSTSARWSCASTIRFFTISTPMWRAVWKPKVSTCGGRSRSLSIVLGTCTTRSAPCGLLRQLHGRKGGVVAADGDELARRRAAAASRSAFSRCSGSSVGLAREMPMCEPPRKWMRLTSSMARGATWSMSPLHDPLEAVPDAEHLDAREAARGWSPRRSRC